MNFNFKPKINENSLKILRTSHLSNNQSNLSFQIPLEKRWNFDGPFRTQSSKKVKMNKKIFLNGSLIESMDDKEEKQMAQ